MSTAPDSFRTFAAIEPEAPGPRSAEPGRAPGAAVGLLGTPAEAAAHAVGVRPLTEMPLRTAGRVVALVAPDEPHDPEILARLGELGFLPGERVRIVARAFLGDPLAVRVGTGTFALRLAEARCVHVRPEA